MTLTERKHNIVFHMVLGHIASLVMVACFVGLQNGGPSALVLPLLVNFFAYVGNAIFLCVYLTGIDSEA